jgi:transposase InsO family protein
MKAETAEQEMLRKRYEEEVKQGLPSSDSDESNSMMSCSIAGLRIIDSGASACFCSDKTLLHEIRRTKVKRVSVAKEGQYYFCDKEGDLIIEGPEGRCIVPAIYAPLANGVYLSVSKLSEYGYSTVFDRDTAVIIRDRKACAMAHLQNGLYVIDSKFVPNVSKNNMSDVVDNNNNNKNRISINNNNIENVNNNNKSDKNVDVHNKKEVKSVSYRTLHNRLGHPSRRRLHQSVEATTGVIIRNNKSNKKRNIIHNNTNTNTASRSSRSSSGSKREVDHSNNNNKDEICITCDKSKTVRAPIRKNTDNIERDVQPLRINTDVKTYPRSIRGYKYFIIFVHEKTRYVSIYCMKRKSESLKYFKEYKAIADASTGGSFIELRSDNGGEYTSKDFQSYLSSNGIAWRPSTPRTPEQNAIAERAIRTICTKVRSMLLHADLSEKYWCYAAEAAAYIYNRMTHKASGNKTPFELFHGYKPNISNLRTFGCIGVSHIKRKTRGPTSVSGQYIRLLGYHPTFGTYIVRTKSGKILSRRVAKWYESTFKYPKAKQKVLDAPASENDEGEKKARTSSSSPSTSPASPKNDKPRRSSRSNRGVPSAQYGYTYAAAEQLTKLIEEVNLDDCFNSSVDYMIEESIQATVAEIEHVPKTYKEAISPEFSKHWIPSMRNELKSLKDLKTFTICKLPSGANLVRTKWVYRNKINPDDTIRRKSRLVAKGFTQREGLF